jgi:hypothetical protein
MSRLRSLPGLTSLLALALAAGCNTLLGVEDVSLFEPDAAPTPTPPPPTCNVSSRLPLVVSNTSTTRLSRTGGGNPSLLFLLNTDSKPDSLSMLLYANMGGHGILEAPGTYGVAAADAKLETCGICLFVNTDYDSVANKFLETFMAEPQGTLTITAATPARLAGRIQRLKFRRVDLSGGVTEEVADPCSVTIDDVVFDMAYATATASATERTAAAALTTARTRPAAP